MNTILIILLLSPLLNFAQKKESGALLLRFGINKSEKVQASPEGSISILGLIKGLGIGTMFGVEYNRHLDKIAIPAAIEVTTLGARNYKIAPIMSAQIGMMYGKNRTISGSSIIDVRGGFLARVLIGAKFPFKKNKFSFIQIGYGSASYITEIKTAERQNSSNAEFGQFIGTVGFK